MMRKLLVSVYKEGLLLLRDIEGVLVMFIMPLILVVIIALLQQKVFEAPEDRIPIIIVDADNEKLSEALVQGLSDSYMFEVNLISNADSSKLKQARKDVAKGNYKIGIFIPANTSKIIKSRAISLVQQQIPGAVKASLDELNAQGEIQLFFDPVTKRSFRDLVKTSLMQFSSAVETQIVFESYSKFIDALTNQSSELEFPKTPAIKFDEKMVSEYTAGIMPNAVQHSIPAWILFGMFLICIPIAGNIIKERGEGSLARLKTMPITYLEIMLGKIIVFVGVCLTQAFLMVLVGMFLMPLLGLPALQIHNWLAFFLISLAAGFAATGFGILIGSVASTHIQASAFGAVATVIFAAIGGAWVPVFAMPAIMQKISAFSPVNWGVHSYYEVFLRNASTLDVLPDITKLFLFSMAFIIASLFFRNYQKTM